MIGKLAYWNQQRGFGVIEVKVAGRIERFWLHCSRIVACEPDEPNVTCYVRFAISDRTPKHEGDLRYAVSAEIFNSETVPVGMQALCQPLPDAASEGGAL